jgi:hypothetical protein
MRTFFAAVVLLNIPIIDVMISKALCICLKSRRINVSYECFNLIQRWLSSQNVALKSMQILSILTKFCGNSQNLYEFSQNLVKIDLICMKCENPVKLKILIWCLIIRPSKIEKIKNLFFVCRATTLVNIEVVKSRVSSILWSRDLLSSTCQSSLCN